MTMHGGGPAAPREGPPALAAAAEAVDSASRVPFMSAAMVGRSRARRRAKTGNIAPSDEEREPVLEARDVRIDYGSEDSDIQEGIPEATPAFSHGQQEAEGAQRGEEDIDPGASEDGEYDDSGSDFDNEEEPPLGPCEVYVRVYRGVGLVACDRTNTSDAYVHVGFRGQFRRTRVMKKSQEQVWDEEFPAFTHEVTQQEPLGGEPIVLTAWDDDLFGKDRIGSFELDLDLVWKSKGHELYRQWVTLVDSTGNSKGVRGYLVIDVAIVPFGSSRNYQHTESEIEGGPDTALAPVSFAMQISL